MSVALARLSFVALSILSLTLNVLAQQPVAASPASVLTVKVMCCAKESVPAIRELSKVPGVKRVTCDYKTKTVKVEHKDGTPSPLAIWEVAERLNIEPIRLATPTFTFTGKPLLK